MERDYLTLAIALVGVGIGIFNTVVSFTRGRPKLRVTPKVFMTAERGLFISEREAFVGCDGLCIEITNLGSVAVTVSEIGFLESSSPKGRLVYTHPVLHDGGTFPRRLEPRQSFMVYSEPGEGKALVTDRVRRAYAKTDCGLMVSGTSRAFKKFLGNVFTT